ncbi:MAG: gamma-glutamylcyclotransferase family protein [Halioglobus sp.]
MNKLFIFGTLKEGFPNFEKNGGTRIRGEFRTAEMYPLYLVGERYSPWLIDTPGKGNYIRGQLFEASAETLKKMDRLERIEAIDGYRRKTIQIQKIGSDTRLITAFAYLKPESQLTNAETKLGPIVSYEKHHAELYQARSL